jgi:hypothetical protein
VKHLTTRDLDQAMGRFTALVRTVGFVIHPIGIQTLRIFTCRRATSQSNAKCCTQATIAPIAGTNHSSTYTQDGCTFILIASEPERLPETLDVAGSHEGLMFVRASEGVWRDGLTNGARRNPSSLIQHVRRIHHWSAWVAEPDCHHIAI